MMTFRCPAIFSLHQVMRMNRRDAEGAEKKLVERSEIPLLGSRAELGRAESQSSFALLWVLSLRSLRLRGSLQSCARRQRDSNLKHAKCERQAWPGGRPSAPAG